MPVRSNIISLICLNRKTPEIDNNKWFNLIRNTYPRYAFCIRFDLIEQLHRMPQFRHWLTNTVQSWWTVVVFHLQLTAGLAISFSYTLLLLSELLQATKHLRVGWQSIEFLPAFFQSLNPRFTVELLTRSTLWFANASKYDLRSSASTI